MKITWQQEEIIERVLRELQTQRENSLTNTTFGANLSEETQRWYKMGLADGYQTAIKVIEAYKISGQ